MQNQSSQSSRIYYKKKDHKDIYAKLTDYPNSMKEPMFHGTMYLKDSDESVADIIWRKQFNNRYFVYTTFGSYYIKDSHGICYIEPKVQIGVVNNGEYNAFTDKFFVSNANYWTDWIHITDSACKSDATYYINGKLPFSRYYSTLYGSKNGYSTRYGGTLFYITLKENEANKCGEIDSCQSISIGEDTENIIVYSHPKSSLVAFNYYSTSEWMILNVDSLESTERFSVPSNIAAYPYTANESSFVNGKMIIHAVGYYYDSTSRDGYYVVSLLEVTENGFVIHNPLTFKGMRPSTALRYHNGKYYLYVTVNESTRIYIGNNLDSFNQINVPDSIMVNSIYDDYPLQVGIGSYTGCFVDAQAVRRAFRIYENNKDELDTSDMALPVKILGYDNYIMLYMDNLTFQASENNFFFKSSEVASTTKPQKMWEYYYKLTEENNGLSETSMG